jgi:hypothetical protein
MFAPKIKLDPSLYERLRAAAKVAGYSDVEEFVRHVLERELSRLEQAGGDERVEERLRGLGYIE